MAMRKMAGAMGAVYFRQNGSWHVVLADGVLMAKKNTIVPSNTDCSLVLGRVNRRSEVSI
jgi:hypothetical protein